MFRFRQFPLSLSVLFRGDEASPMYAFSLVVWGGVGVCSLLCRKSFLRTFANALLPLASGC